MEEKDGGKRDSTHPFCNQGDPIRQHDEDAVPKRALVRSSDGVNTKEFFE